MPERRRKFDEQLWQMQVPLSPATSMSCFGKPHAVAQRQMRPEHPKPIKMLDRGRASAAQRIFLLVGRLKEMHVHRHPGPARLLGDGEQLVVRDPVQIGGAELDLRQRLCPWLSAVNRSNKAKASSNGMV